jgi:hypothetical protein
MMSGPRTPIATPLASTATEQPRQAVRSRMKPEAPTTGYVDGAWWPRSRNLSAELPTLLAVLAIRPGPIERVTYNLTAGNPTERRLPFGDHAGRLEDFRSQDLLVVPPEAAPATAEHALTTASKRDNAETAKVVLGDTRTDAVTQSWEVDGGRVYEPA